MKHTAALVLVGLLAFLYAGEPVFAYSYFYCESDRFLCDTFWCIPENAVCDGRRDCKDGTDEECCGNECSTSTVVAVVVPVVVVVVLMILCGVGVVVGLICHYKRRSTAGRHSRLTHVTVHTFETDGSHAIVASSKDASNPPSHIPLEPGQYQPMTSFTPDQ